MNEADWLLASFFYSFDVGQSITLKQFKQTVIF